MQATVIHEKTLHKFEKDAVIYEKTSDGRFCSRVYPDIVKAICSVPFESLLDIGCGTGSILYQIPADKKRYGIDLSEQMIKRSKELLKDAAELKVGNAESLPWSQESFDTVSCTFSFHHYPNPGRVLSEMNRVLKADGRLILADPWLPMPFLSILNALLQFSDGGDYHEYSRRKIAKLLTASGFRLLTFRHPTHDSFLLTAQKVSGKGKI